MSDTEQKAAEKLYKEHGMSLTRAAAAAGMARSTFTKLLRGEVPAKPRKTLTKPAEGPGGPAPARGVGKTLAEFRSTFDKNVIVPARIRAGLSALGSNWEYEVAFAKFCGVSLADMSNFRELFTDNWLAVKREGRRVWSSKATIRAMREML